MKLRIWFSILSLLFTIQPASLADTANPPRIQSIEIVESKVYKPGDVMRIKVSYTGGNPGLTGIYVDAPCLRSALGAYSYSWEIGRTRMEFFSYFQYLMKPDSNVDQTVYATVSNYCPDGVKKISVTIEDATRLSDSSGQRGIEKTFTVQGGQLLEAGVIRPNKGNDVIELKNIPASLSFDSGQVVSYQLPRTSKNGQVIWWTARGACRVNVPFFLDAGGTLVPTGQGICDLQPFLYPSDLLLAPEVDANVQFLRSNNWDFPKVGQYRVVDAGAAKAAEAKAKADAEAKAKADAEAKAKAEADVKARLEAAAKASAEAEVVCKNFRGETQKLKAEALTLITQFPSALKSISAYLEDERFYAACPDSKSVEFLRSRLKDISDTLTSRKSTITCVKGKLTKKVTAVNPKCPKGYKKK
jgi:hypothetical protein